MLLLTIAGIAVTALAPVFRMLLEGRTANTILSPVFERIRADQRAEAKQRQNARAATRRQLGARMRFRLAREERVKAARREAPVKEQPPAEAIERVESAVRSALAADAGEAGAAAAIDALVRHFAEFGARGTHAAYTAILDRFDALVNEPRTELARMARLGADLSAPDAPVTRYGQELQVIETYVASTYNIESIVFWTRLQHVVPSTYAERLADAKHALDLLSSLTVLLWLSLAGWLIVLPLTFPSGLVLGAVAIGGWLVGYITYRAATAAALSFAELVCAAFDLFRRQLLAEIGIQPPESFREERQIWLSLGQLVVYGQVPDDLKLRPLSAALTTMGSGIPVPSTTNTIPIPTVTQRDGN
jgi:hypothetical protein